MKVPTDTNGVVVAKGKKKVEVENLFLTFLLRRGRKKVMKAPKRVKILSTLSARGLPSEIPL